MSINSDLGLQIPALSHLFKKIALRASIITTLVKIGHEMAR